MFLGVRENKSKFSDRMWQIPVGFTFLSGTYKKSFWKKLFKISKPDKASQHISQSIVRYGDRFSYTCVYTIQRQLFRAAPATKLNVNPPHCFRRSSFGNRMGSPLYYQIPRKATVIPAEDRNSQVGFIWKPPSRRVNFDKTYFPAGKGFYRTCIFKTLWKRSCRFPKLRADQSHRSGRQEWNITIETLLNYLPVPCPLW